MTIQGAPSDKLLAATLADAFGQAAEIYVRRERDDNVIRMTKLPQVQVDLIIASLRIASS